MSKITYLLGSGASCNALPMVNDFPEKLASFLKERLEENIRIRLYKENKVDSAAKCLLPPKGEYAKDLIESIAWLEEKAKRHASIDTYAKKLFIRNDNDALIELKKLKATLSCYFLLEQSLQPVDKRYDNFFASILTKDLTSMPVLPNGINIITWNYDTQLEKSYEEFCQSPSFVFKGMTGNKNIIRLNGTCALPYKIDTRFLGHTDFSISFLESIIELFKNFMKPEVIGYQPNISFAWEKKDIENNISEVLKGTTTLVIIGYSLPYFNREIDKMIIYSMHPTLVKIFIQVKEKEYESHKERFLTFYDNILMKQTMEAKINMVSGTDLFYIPDDMPR